MNSLRILDPIHGLIHFDDYDFQPLLLRLINSRVFQRLRGVRQLGLTELVYPGASHARFSHSLGVAHLARIITQKVRREVGAVFTERLQEQVILAALLHDIGHGPYSHVFERVEGDQICHEKVGALLLQSTEMKTIFAEFDRSCDLDAIACLWRGQDISANISGLSTIVSGALDADRLDYLHRDQVLTGSFQGRFDWPWLLDNIVWSPKGLALGHRAVYAAEEYLLARSHMYQTVYFHRTVRGVEAILIRFLRRFCALSQSSAISTGLALGRWYNQAVQTRNVVDFLALDDAHLQHVFATLESGKDEALAQDARRLRYRLLYHCHEATAAEKQYLLPRLQTAAQREELTAQTGVWVDEVYFKPYDSTQPILIEADGEWVELSKVSKIVQSLEHPVQHLRLYYEDAEQLRHALALYS